MFLYSDSKGLSLKEFIPSNLKDKITVVAKGGATVADRKLKDNLLELVEKSRDPIVLCELTGKKRKYISTRHYNYKYQNVEYKLDEYRELLSKIKEANPTATVIFLECPYYSIYAYNSRNNTVNRTSKDNNNNTTIVKTKGRSLQVTKRKQYPVLIINKTNIENREWLLVNPRLTRNCVL